MHPELHHWIYEEMSQDFEQEIFIPCMKLLFCHIYGELQLADLMAALLGQQEGC